MKKRNGGVNKERVSGWRFGAGGEETDERVRCLVEEGTGDDVEKLGAVGENYLERNRGKPEYESG